MEKPNQQEGCVRVLSASMQTNACMTIFTAVLLVCAPSCPFPPKQFFSALSVFALVLVCTSVFMTQKPPWMEGQEADLGISSPFIGPDASSKPYRYNDPQMTDMGAGPSEDEDEEDAEKGRPQALAQIKGRPLSGRAAVQAAAAHPGGLLHGDDAYVRVGTGQVLTAQQRVKAARGDEMKEAQQLRAVASQRGRVRAAPVHYKGNDAEVPVTQIKAQTYPLMNLASEDSNGEGANGPEPPAANKLLAAKIKEAGAGNGNYIDTTEGTMTSVPPITQIGSAVAKMGYSGTLSYYYSLSLSLSLSLISWDACAPSHSLSLAISLLHYRVWFGVTLSSDFYAPVLS